MRQFFKNFMKRLPYFLILPIFPVCYKGGGNGGTQTVVQTPTEAQRIEGQILAALAPYIEQYGAATLPGKTSLDVQKNQILQSLMPMLASYAGGGPTSQGSQNVLNLLQQVKGQAGQLGIRPGDPRLTQATTQMNEGMTKGNLNAVGTILSLFGGASSMDPQSLLGLMGAGAPGATTTSKTMSDLERMQMVQGAQGIMKTGSGMGG